MNKKSVAVGIFKDPAIQQLLKEGILTSSQLNKIIVEEIMDEALEDWQKKAISNVQNAINRKLKNDPVFFVHATQLAKKGDPSGIRPDDAEFWNHLDDKQKKWVADRFLNATRTKKVLVAMTQALVDKKGAEPEKAAAVVVDATGTEGEVKPEALANAAGGEDTARDGDLVAKLTKIFTDVLLSHKNSSSTPTEDRDKQRGWSTLEQWWRNKDKGKTVTAEEIKASEASEAFKAAVKTWQETTPGEAPPEMTLEKLTKILTDMLLDKGRAVPTSERTDEAADELERQWYADDGGEDLVDVGDLLSRTGKEAFKAAVKTWQETPPGGEEEENEEQAFDIALDQLDAVLPKYKAELEKFEQPTSSDGRGISYFQDADDHPSKPFLDWFNNMLAGETELRAALNTVDQKFGSRWTDEKLFKGGLSDSGMITSSINDVKNASEEEAPEGGDKYEEAKEFLQRYGATEPPSGTGGGPTEEKLLLRRTELQVDEAHWQTEDNSVHPELARFRDVTWPKLKEDGVIVDVEGKPGFVKIATGEETPERERLPGKGEEYFANLNNSKNLDDYGSWYKKLQRVTGKKGVEFEKVLDAAMKDPKNQDTWVKGGRGSINPKDAWLMLSAFGVDRGPPPNNPDHVPHLKLFNDLVAQYKAAGGAPETPEEVSPEVEELVDEVEPQVEAEEEKTGQELGRDDVEKVARDEVSDVAPEKTPEEQEKIVQQAADIVTGEASTSNAALSKEIYDSFDDNEKEALRLFQQFLSKEGLLQEVRNFRQLIGLDPMKIRNFQDEIKGNQSVFDGWSSLLRKVNADNKQMKGVNWFLDQPSAGEETPEESPEVEATSEVIAQAVPPQAIENLKKGFEPFRTDFMKAVTLQQQGELYRGVWEPVKIIAGRIQHALDQQQKALTEEAPASPAADHSKVISDASTLQRHIDSVSKALKIYKRYLDAGTLAMGSKESLALHGQKDPKKAVYKFLKLIMLDANSTINHIDALLTPAAPSPETITEEENPESEVEESREEKIKRVRGVHAQVIEFEGIPSLLQMLEKVSAKEPAAPTKPTGEPTEEPAPAPEDLAEEEAREPTPEVATTVKDKAENIYQLLATIKEYFPNANPLKSERGMDAAITEFDNAILGMKKIIAQVVGSRPTISDNLLREFQSALVGLKESLIDIFKVADTSKVAGLTDSGTRAAEEGKLEPEPGEPTVPGVDTDAAHEDTGEGEPDERKELKLTNLTTLDTFMRQKVLKGTPLAKYNDIKDKEKDNLLVLIAWLYGMPRPPVAEASWTASIGQLNRALVTSPWGGKASEEHVRAVYKTLNAKNQLALIHAIRIFKTEKVGVQRFLASLANEIDKQFNIIGEINPTVLVNFDPKGLFKKEKEPSAPEGPSSSRKAISRQRGRVGGVAGGGIGGITAEELEKSLEPIIKAQLQRLKDG